MVWRVSQQQLNKQQVIAVLEDTQRLQLLQLDLSVLTAAESVLRTLVSAVTFVSTYDRTTKSTDYHKQASKYCRLCEACYLTCCTWWMTVVSDQPVPHGAVPSVVCKSPLCWLQTLSWYLSVDSWLPVSGLPSGLDIYNAVSKLTLYMCLCVILGCWGCAIQTDALQRGLLERRGRRGQGDTPPCPSPQYLRSISSV